MEPNLRAKIHGVPIEAMAEVIMLPFECRQGGYKGPLLAERIELHLDSVTSYEDLAGTSLAQCLVFCRLLI